MSSLLDLFQKKSDNRLPRVRTHEMELLVRVAEAGSMTRAAQQLRMTAAAVSATVQRIEEGIGIRIFERTTRSLRPTDEGLVVIEGCRDIVDLWQRTLDDASARRTAFEGEIQIAAPVDTTYQTLRPILAELCVEHPKLRVVLNATDTIQHMHREAIDIAIRYGSLLDSTLSARKLADCPGVFVAAPSYLEHAGHPKTPRALAGHRCLTLQLSNVPTTSWRLEGKGRVQDVALKSPLCGDGYLARQWAIDGLGIALKSIFDVIDDLEDGRLVQVLPDYTCGPVPIHAVFPSRRFITARVRALYTVIESRFATRARRCRAWLAGHGTAGPS